MPYSRNFGFRSFENIVRQGRQRTPASGDLLVIGSGVTLDTAHPGFLKLATAGADPDGISGVLVYEHITAAGIGGFNGIDPQLTSSVDAPWNLVPRNAYAQIVRGPGSKVWFRNTSDKPLYDGRTQVGETIIAGLGATPTLAVGDFLTPAGDGTWKEASGGDGHWFQVEQVDVAAGRVEARCLF